MSLDQKMSKSVRPAIKINICSIQKNIELCDLSE